MPTIKYCHGQSCRPRLSELCRKIVFTLQNASVIWWKRALPPFLGHNRRIPLRMFRAFAIPWRWVFVHSNSKCEIIARVATLLRGTLYPSLCPFAVRFIGRSSWTIYLLFIYFILQCFSLSRECFRLCCALVSVHGTVHESWKEQFKRLSMLSNHVKISQRENTEGQRERESFTAALQCYS